MLHRNRDNPGLGSIRAQEDVLGGNDLIWNPRDTSDRFDLRTPADQTR